jgi:hypothetical protein
MGTATATEEKLDLHDVHVVQRGNWSSDGIDRERGEVLVTKGWRNHKALVNTRYLAAADYSLADTIVSCECGRRWESDERMNDHDCPASK